MKRHKSKLNWSAVHGLIDSDISQSIEIARKYSFVDTPDVRLCVSDGSLIEFTATDKIRIVEEPDKQSIVYINLHPGNVRDILIGKIVAHYESELAQLRAFNADLQASSSGLKFRNDSLSHLVSTLEARRNHKRKPKQLPLPLDTNDE
jgi:hypothetical protein